MAAGGNVTEIRDWVVNVEIDGNIRRGVSLNLNEDFTSLSEDLKKGRKEV